MAAARMEQSLRIGVTSPALVRVDAAEIAAFCQRHKLDDDMCQHFVAKALDPLDCLLEFNDDELKNGKHYLTATFIAALRLAAKKALLEKDSTVRVITPKEETADEGQGDRGGDSGRPGVGGASGSVETRGFGGAGGRPGALKVHVFGATDGISDEGGQEKGDEHDSLDEAPQMPTLFVALFTRVPIGQSYLGLTGGRGGQGGTGSDGRGQDGESQEIILLVFSYHEEPSRPRPFMMLTPSEVPANLRRLLLDEEFQFVGGLFEAYDTDMQSRSFVSVVWKKFVARQEILGRSTN
ncbi:hypothetical protein C8R45DRAFT_420740 [Mycena sanguinolenta]|nr:hypothetical protein C8R45DRAFT_420740 [Mycena sanguinolenta]